jgi:hypothetical protein
MSAGKVDDRKAAHSDRRYAINEHTLIVGPAMRDCPAHTVEHLARIDSVATVMMIYESGYATHIRSSVRQTIKT